MPVKEQKAGASNKRRPQGPPQASPAAKKHKQTKPTKPAPPAKLNRKERKELDKERKARRNKNFGLIEEAKGLWEELRRHDLSADKRAKLVTAILAKCQGRLAELAGSHSASRIIQSCAKYGSAAERAAILKELQPKLLELAKSPYGHFVVSKLVALAPKEQLPGLLKAFRGHLGELLRHPAGCHVVDDLYAAADAKQRNLMAAEFYGKEYVLFEGGTLNNTEGAPARLADLFARVDGAKRRSVVQHMSKDLVPISEKGLVDCPLVHRLLSEYLELAPASLVADAAENLAGEPLLHMVHTKEGAKAACMVLAYGTAKDRKKALKAMKGHVGAMARDEWGHLALITALSVVDDTALLRKTVVAELQTDLAELAEHKYGYRVLVQLLHPYSPRCLPPQLLALARPAPKEYSAEAMQRGAAAGPDQQQQQQQQENSAGGDAASDSDDEQGGGGRRPTSGPLGASKKAPEVRRRELLGSGGGSLAAALAELCEQRAAALLRSQHGSEVLVEACCGGQTGLLADCLQGGPALAAVHDALVAAVADGSAGPATGEAGGQEAGEEEPALSHFFGSRALRRLVLASTCDDAPAAAAAAEFVGKLWRGALRGRSAPWVHTHAAKVLAALLKCGEPSVRAEAAKELAAAVPGSLDDWAAKLTGGGEKGPAAQGHSQSAGKKPNNKQKA